MAAQAASYRFKRYVNFPSVSDMQPTVATANYGSGYVPLPSRFDLYPFSIRGHVGHDGVLSQQMAVDVLADALAVGAGGPDAAGDLRAVKGSRQFVQHYISRVPAATDSVEVTRATVLQIVANLGI